MNKPELIIALDYAKRQSANGDEVIATLLDEKQILLAELHQLKQIIEENNYE